MLPTKFDALLCMKTRHIRIPKFSEDIIAVPPVKLHTPKSNQHQIISRCKSILNVLNFCRFVLEMQCPQNFEDMQTDRPTHRQMFSKND